ncbi:hypothetical protein NP233_g8436 [Leucocoprinus birnbaumii]|uniref:Uncharacterized protein n=1 Tax=Leucocoprinus birnbaumii TaxID=56174 RepID=A0AAD5VMK0_9AGAR|nr:hypothetical protein NP233_g8436 [Leucocoprinus birnbaumii]
MQRARFIPIMVETAIYIDFRRRPRLLIRIEGLDDASCPWLDHHIRDLYQDSRVGTRTGGARDLEEFVVSATEPMPEGDIDYVPDEEDRGGEESEGDVRCKGCWDQGCDGCNGIAEDDGLDAKGDIEMNGEFISILEDTSCFEASVLIAQGTAVPTGVDATAPPPASTSTHLPASLNSPSTPVADNSVYPPAPPPSPQSVSEALEVAEILEVRSPFPSPKLIYENGRHLYDITHF